MSQDISKSEKISQSEAARVKESETGCCGGAAPAGQDGCCALDAEIKSAGGSGCGCGAKAASGARQKGGCC